MTNTAAMSTNTTVVAHITHEGWDAFDVQAASLQASLLSYQARNIGAREQLFELVLSMQPRYTPTSPTTYAHNCPWNDWTPPSESRQRHVAASAAGSGGLVRQLGAWG